MGSVICQLPCLLTYSVTLPCIILTLAQCAPIVTYCPNFDGTPQYYSDEDGKCHLCLSCEEGYGLSEVCGAGHGQHARCIPCPSGYYSHTYDWNMCGVCRICDNTMEDAIPCTARTDRQCGLCKLGYFRYEERHDMCLSCEDELNSHLYPDCLRTTPRPMTAVTHQYPVSMESTGHAGNTGLKPWTIVIVVLCVCVVFVVLVIIIYFLKDHLCHNWKKCFSKRNSSFQQNNNKERIDKANGSPTETVALIVPHVPDPRHIAGDDTITHNGQKVEDGRQGATPICGPGNSAAPCRPQDSRMPRTMTVDVELNHITDRSPATLQEDLNNIENDGDGGETSGQSQSCHEEQLPALGNNSIQCNEKQTEDMDMAASFGQHSSGSSSDDKEPCEDNLVVSKSEAQPCHSDGEGSYANRAPTQTCSSELGSDASRRQHFLRRLEQACKATEGVFLGDMHQKDINLLDNILYVKPENEDTSREFNHTSMAKVFGIDEYDRRRFRMASDVITHLADTDPTHPTVAIFLRKLEQSNKCFIVLNKLVNQIIKR